MSRPDFMMLHAQAIAPLPEGWRWYQWDLVNHGTPHEAHRITGCVPSRTYTRGPRKGRPVFNEPVPGTTMSLQFSVEDHKAFMRRWEIETGLCAECGGSGQAFAGWSATEGSKYRDCRPCGATGKVAASHEEGQP